MNIKIDRNNNFDFLRCLAAVMVILSHSFALTGADNRELLVRLTNGQWTLGGIAVAIFFMISGYLITQSYNNSVNISEFSIKRALRIFPGLIVVVVISSFVLGPIISTLPFREYLSHAQTYRYLLHTSILFPIEYSLPGVFNSNIYPNAVNGSIWTIPYELICYAMVGLLGVFGFLKKGKAISFLLLVCLVSFYFLPSSILNVIKGDIIISHMIELSIYFLTGVLFCLYRTKIKFNYVYLVLSLVALFYCCFNGNFKFVFFLVGPYIVFFLAFNQKLRLYSFSKYGDFSYGLYIYAFPVQQLIVYIFKNNIDPKTNFLIALPVTFVLAFMSWHLVEKRFIKKKNYFYKKLLNFQAEKDLTA